MKDPFLKCKRAQQTFEKFKYCFPTLKCKECPLRCICMCVCQPMILACSMMTLTAHMGISDSMYYIVYIDLLINDSAWMQIQIGGIINLLQHDLLRLNGSYNHSRWMILVHLTGCVTADLLLSRSALQCKGLVPGAAETDSFAHYICASCVARIETSCLPVSLSHTPGLRQWPWRAICHAKTHTHPHKGSARMKLTYI